MRKALSSPLLLVFLLLSTAGLSGALWKIDRSRRAAEAPELAGYGWDSHPNVLMVVYPMADACSTCNLSVYGWALKGREHKVEVVVAANKDSLELRSLRKEAMEGVTVVTGVAPSFIEQFAKGDKIGGVRVVDGRIVHKQLGGSPREGFFSKGR